MKKIFITGTAGFIGFHLAKKLLEQGYIVHGFDCISDYYDVTLKEKRHEILSEFDSFLIQLSILRILINFIKQLMVFRLK